MEDPHRELQVRGLHGGTNTDTYSNTDGYSYSNGNADSYGYRHNCAYPNANANTDTAIGSNDLVAGGDGHHSCN